MVGMLTWTSDGIESGQELAEDKFELRVATIESRYFAVFSLM